MLESKFFFANGKQKQIADLHFLIKQVKHILHIDKRCLDQPLKKYR